MQDFSGQKILVGVCGGIAAYKTADLIRNLKSVGAEVQVVMTEAAQSFITPLTLQALSGHPVRTACLDVEAEQAMGHIELARWADYLLIAPATANCIAKMAQGLADDLLSTLYLAIKAPVIVCPAMNQAMWAHPATVHNVEILRKRGVYFSGPDWGEQACGDVGLGRLTSNDEIIDALRLLNIRNMFVNKHVVITAGPTREALDPVRYLTNKSSGKMGYALARAARAAGARVSLVSGPCHLAPPNDVACIRVETAVEMYDSVMSALTPGCIFIGAAAVADFAPLQVSTQKIKKQVHDLPSVPLSPSTHQANPVLSDPLSPSTLGVRVRGKLEVTNQVGQNLDLKLRANPDIAASVALRGTCSYVVGFAAETDNLLAYARAKRISKKLDMIIANQVGENLGFDAAENTVTVLTEAFETALPKMHKTRLAAEIVSQVARSLEL